MKDLQMVYFRVLTTNVACQPGSCSCESGSECEGLELFILVLFCNNTLNALYNYTKLSLYSYSINFVLFTKFSLYIFC